MPDASTKRDKGGRPKKDYVLVEFRLSLPQADCLLDMGKRFGWGDTHNGAAQTLIVSKITEFQEASFKSHPWRFGD